MKLHKKRKTTIYSYCLYVSPLFTNYFNLWQIEYSSRSRNSYPRFTLYHSIHSILYFKCHKIIEQKKSKKKVKQKKGKKKKKEKNGMKNKYFQLIYAIPGPGCLEHPLLLCSSTPVVAFGVSSPPPVVSAHVLQPHPPHVPPSNCAALRGKAQLPLPPCPSHHRPQSQSQHVAYPG